jgi:hypothetical protein
MKTNTASQSDITIFIKRLESSVAVERANNQIFLTELCAVQEVRRPEPNLGICPDAIMYFRSDGDQELRKRRY